MNGLQLIKGVECYIDENGVAQLNLEHVARGLGFTTVATSGNECVRWSRVDGYLESCNVPTSGDECSRPKYIPEPIFYLLAMKADNQTAKAFQHAVAYDILPSIRKHGLYAKDELLEDPDLLIEIITELKHERQQRKLLEAQTAQLEQRVSEYEPKVQYLDTILQSKGTLTVTQIAADYGLSAKMLNKILHDEHIQHNVGGQWILYKSHMSLGYTKSETFHFEHSNGMLDTNMRTRWTQKGRLLVHNILEHRGISANMDRQNNS